MSPHRPSLLAAAVLGLAAACTPATGTPPGGAAAPAPARTAIAAEPGEANLANLRQLTNGGENAEAYFSADGQWITFQSTRDGRTCDQQFVMRTDGTGLTKVSVGGKTTCGWFLPGSQRLFFASTHAADSACPPRPDPSAGYVWGIDPFDIYTVGRDGKELKR